MIRYPEKITGAIEALSELPGIGRKTAERFVFHLLRQSPAVVADFLRRLNLLANSHYHCPQCFNFSESGALCPICADSKRDSGLICVAEDVHDLVVIENTGVYRGLYHILGGKLDPVEGRGPENLKIKELLGRAKNGATREIILALNPDFQGEGTALYLKTALANLPIKLTRLARGLPMGAEIEYADESTLANALNSRQNINDKSS